MRSSVQNALCLMTLNQFFPYLCIAGPIMMKTSLFSNHLFWSYQKNADLPVDIVVRQVILYGEVSDMIILSKEVDHKYIRQIANELTKNGRNRKRIFFLNKIVLE